MAYAQYHPGRAPQGFMLLYRPEVVNHCPGCTHTNWYVGRNIAECAFCGTALPLRDHAHSRSWSLQPELAAA